MNLFWFQVFSILAALLVNRSQAIILYLQTLDLPVEVVDNLYHANESLIKAMRKKIGR